MNRLRLKIIIFLALLSPLLTAQERMTLDEAILQALEHNYSLKITRNNESIARNNVSIAPFLPAVTGTGRESQTNTRSITSAGNDDRSLNNQYTAGIALNWRLFDGLGMFAAYNRQKELLAMSSQRVKISIENLILRLSSEYYNIIVQQNRMESALTSLALSRSRYEIAEEKYLLGVISGLELQQARIDLNADSSAVLTRQETVKSAYIRLTNLLNAGHEINFSISDTIILAREMKIDSLREQTLLYNNQLLLARQGEQLSQYDLESVRAARYPTLNFSTGYNITRNEFPRQPVTFNETGGVNWGFNISWNIFSGFETSRRISNAKIDAENSKLAYLDAENEILGDLELLYNTYRNNIIVTTFEAQSVEVTQASLEIAMERYRLGSLSGLEFREYQNNYLNAIDRRLTALYQAKISETNLRLLAGELSE